MRKSRISRVGSRSNGAGPRLYARVMTCPQEQDARGEARTGPALAVLDTLLTAGNSARLQRRLVDTGWASSAGAFLPPFQHEALYEFSVTMREGKAADAGLEVIRTLNDHDVRTEAPIEVVVWTNEYGPMKTKIFSTTLGHNNDTVGDARYLDLITRGVLWTTGNLGSDGKATAACAK